MGVLSMEAHHKSWSSGDPRSSWQPCQTLVSLLSFEALVPFHLL